MGTEPLIAAVAGLWLVLTTLAGGAFWYLKEQIKLERTACDARVVKLEAKLDVSSAIIHKQAESQQAQIVSQQAMIKALQELLAKEAAA